MSLFYFFYAPQKYQPLDLRDFFAGLYNIVIVIRFGNRDFEYIMLEY